MHTNTKEEELLLLTVRNNPELGRCVLEMLEIAGEDIDDINLADDAEEIVVENIKKTGKELLTTWARNKQKKLHEQVKSKENVRLHEKKT